MAELISFTLNKAAAVVKNSLTLHLNEVKGVDQTRGAVLLQWIKDVLHLPI